MRGILALEFGDFFSNIIYCQFMQSVGSTLSREHGIDLVQRPYLDIVSSAVELRLMREIKGVFDPLGILNPGKVVG